MSIVVDRSGNNPGNPITNGWSGVDPHNKTTDELQRDYYAAGSVSAFWQPILILTDPVASRAAIGCNDAANLTTGVLDPARIPAINSSVQVISTSATIAGLSAGEQTQVVKGCILTLTDGTRWTYTGAGSKTLQASYINLSDVTPDWSVIANKPNPSAVQLLDNSLTGVLGSGPNYSYEDHKHPYPGAVINTQSGTTYTLVASDHGKIVELTNASAITLTLPNSLGVGFNCSIYQGGAGQITVTAGAGSTMRQRYSLTKTSGLYAEVAIRVRTNAGGTAAEYVVSGDMA